MQSPAHYLEHTPAPPLGALVRCYWSISGTVQGNAPNRVVPDGCMDVIFDLRASVVKHAAFVVGAMLTAEVIEHTGAIDMMGIRFVPGAAPLFLDIRADQLTARTVRADSLWTNLPGLIDQLREASLTDRVRILDAFLLSTLDERRRDDLALRAMGMVQRSRGMLTVAGIRESLNVSERALQRAFGSAVGLTPKQALRVARFRHSLSWLARTDPPALARIAILTGHTDQAHFTREFRELAGLTPRAYLIERRLVGFVQDDQADVDYPSLE